LFNKNLSVTLQKNFCINQNILIYGLLYFKFPRKGTEKQLAEPIGKNGFCHTLLYRHAK